MPLPRYFGAPVERPPGLVPPAVALDGVTEIRIHGVGGTTPENLLGDLAPQQVAGDRTAGFYRSADAGGRHIEAYSWGGLTSRSGSRALWLLLLPFTLANLAGWMCSSRVPRSPRLSRWHRWSVRLAALGVTVNVLLVLTLLSVDVVGYQCGGQTSCVDRHWWLAPMRWLPVQPYAGQRIALGALLPLGTIVVLALLAHRTRSRYESVRPAHHGARPPAVSQRSAAALPDGLTDPRFWDGRRATQRLAHLHVAAALAFLAAVVAHTTRTTVTTAGSDPTQTWLWLAALVFSGAVVAAVLAGLAVETLPDAVPRGVLALAAAATVAAGAFALAQPALGVEPAGQLPGVRFASNATYAAVLVTLGLVLVVVLCSGSDRGAFRWGAPFVVLSLAVALLNAVLLGALIRIAALTGGIQWNAGRGRALDDLVSPTVFVFPVIGRAAPYLTLVPLLLLAAFLLVEAVLWVRAGTTCQEAITAEYRERERQEPPPAPPPPALWWSSALDKPGWVRRIGRARRFARVATDLQYLLTAIAATGVVILVLSEVRIWFGRGLPAPFFIAAGTTLASLLPVAVVLQLRRGWKDLDRRRRIGVLWDVATFWPRSFHPLAPPSYAERAVPELQRRLWLLHDCGGAVLLATHSQGTIVAAAALVQPSARPAARQVSLVTFGSPLAKLYGWAFPAYFTPALLGTLAEDSDLVRWRNFSYATDYIGGPVLADVDTTLADPPTSRYRHGEPLPALAQHTGYWTDRRLWAAVDEMAAELAAAGRPTSVDLDRADRPTAPAPRSGSVLRDRLDR